MVHRPTLSPKNCKWCVKTISRTSSVLRGLLLVLNARLWSQFSGVTAQIPTNRGRGNERKRKVREGGKGKETWRVEEWRVGILPQRRILYTPLILCGRDAANVKLHRSGNASFSGFTCQPGSDRHSALFKATGEHTVAQKQTA